MYVTKYNWFLINIDDSIMFWGKFADSDAEMGASDRSMVPVKKPSGIVPNNKKYSSNKNSKMSITLKEFGLHFKNKVNKSMPGLDDYILVISFNTHIHQLHSCCCCCGLHIFI